MTDDLFDNASPAAPDARKDLFGPVFVARLEGECSACGWEIQPGEDIRADGDGGWIHADDDCERMAR